MTGLVALGWWLVAVNIVAHGQAVDVTAKVVIHSTSHGASAKKTSGASDVVVWLTPLQPQASSPARSSGPYRLLQREKQFSPHLLVVPRGSSVEFPNVDPFFHNVFSLFNGKRFDLGLYESGTSRSVKFDREGVSYIFCNIHPEMGAIVLALSTPYYAISGQDGGVVIRGTPQGNYRMEVWSEQARASSSSYPRIVQVSASGANLGEIEMEAVMSFMTDHKNKFGEDYRPPPAGTPY